MIHPLSDVQTIYIGSNTNVWQYSIILKNAKIGDNCNINCHTFIENDVQIGNNVTVKSGVYIWDGIILEDDVFIGPNVTFTNDLRPRSKKRVEFSKTIICKGASLGANTTVLAGTRIGKFSMTGIGSVITRDVPDYALVFGNPAVVKGWVDELGNKLVRLENDIWIGKSNSKFQMSNGLMIKIL